MSTADERRLRAQVAANRRWAFEPDRRAATEAARRAAEEKFSREVDPHNQLDPADRARRAASLRRAYFQELALKSARARRRARELLEDADAAEAAARLGQSREPA